MRSRGLLLLAVALGSCALHAGCDDDPAAPVGGSGNPVRFDALQAGQASRYLYFDCDRYAEPDLGTATYQPDTLVLAVAGADPAGGFRVTESLTPGSVSRHGGGNVTDPDSVYSYRLVVERDSVFVHKPAGIPVWGGSRLFVAQTNGFPLTPVGSPVTRFVGWQPDLPYHEDLATARVEQHHQHGANFAGLNILQDNRAMQLDGPGYLFAYAPAHGLVRWATYSWWTRSGHGWDLLPGR